MKTFGTIVLAGLVCGALGLAPFRQEPNARLPTEETAQDLEARLSELGLVLPPASPPVGVYRRVVVVGNLAYVSGHLPIDAEGKIVTGIVGQELTVDQGRAAARQTALAILASLRAELGSLNRIRRLVKTTGMVRCTSDFADQPAVVNGCSELFRDLLGPEAGVGARAAVGMVALPRGAAVEVEAIFELQPAE